MRATFLTGQGAAPANMGPLVLGRLDAPAYDDAALAARVEALEAAPVPDVLPDGALLLIPAGAAIPDGWFSVNIFNAGGVSLRVLSREAPAAAAPVLVLPLPDLALTLGGDPVVIDLRQHIPGDGMSYARTPAVGVLDGYTLTIDPAAVLEPIDVTVTGENAAGEAQDVFSLAVAAPAVPIPEISSLYFDAADAPIGDVTALQTRGSWAAVLSNAAFTGGAVAQMGPEGLRTRGNILRNISSQGPLRKITILADVVRDAITNGSRADVITINPNLAADFRLYLQFDPNRFMVTGPGGVILNLPTQWGFGARHVIGVELDLVAGRLTVMEPDGDTQSAAVPAVPLTIGRIEVGKAANSLIHKLALVTELAA